MQQFAGHSRWRRIRRNGFTKDRKSNAPGEVELHLVALIKRWQALSSAVQQQMMLLVG